MSCRVCFQIFGSDVQTITLPCSCTHCADCLSSWVLTKTQDLEYLAKEEIPCMRSGCKESFKPQTILDLLSSENHQMVDNALLDVYLKKTEDVRKCPNSSCPYAGTIDTNAKCDSPVECSLCETQWHEKVHEHSSEGMIKSLVRGNIDAREFSSMIWEEFFTKKCPKCNTSIQKNGGCSHMTCKRCGYEFCWYCTQENYSHSENACWINFMVRMVLVVMFVVQVIYLVGAYDLIMDAVQIVCGEILEVFFLNSFLYLLCMLFPYDAFGKGDSDKKVRSIASLILLGSFLFTMHLLEAFYSIFRIFVVQIGMVGLGLLYVDCLERWINNTY